MKNKYFVLFVAAVLCFTMLFGTSAMALDLDNIEIPNETVGDVLEGVLGEDPGVVGDGIKDGIYEGRDFLQLLTQAINNFKILLTNLLSEFFGMLGVGESDSLLG